MLLSTFISILFENFCTLDPSYHILHCVCLYQMCICVFFKVCNIPWQVIPWIVIISAHSLILYNLLNNCLWNVFPISLNFLSSKIKNWYLFFNWFNFIGTELSKSSSISICVLRIQIYGPKSSIQSNNSSFLVKSAEKHNLVFFF